MCDGHDCAFGAFGSLTGSAHGKGLLFVTFTPIRLPISPTLPGRKDRIVAMMVTTVVMCVGSLVSQLMICMMCPNYGTIRSNTLTVHVVEFVEVIDSLTLLLSRFANVGVIAPP
jgi:hypothetical protein